jgi:hypothetical protein
MADGDGKTGADLVVEHLAECTDAKAMIVVDGNADDIVARMVAAGWGLRERTDHIAGKRIRYLTGPGQEPGS